MTICDRCRATGNSVRSFTLSLGVTDPRKADPGETASAQTTFDLCQQCWNNVGLDELKRVVLFVPPILSDPVENVIWQDNSLTPEQRERLIERTRAARTG